MRGIVLLVALLVPFIARADVLTFDDITTDTTGFTPVLNYQGFTFDPTFSAAVISDVAYNALTGESSAFPSGGYALMNFSAASSVTVDRSEPFDLESLQIAGFGEPGKVTLTVAAEDGAPAVFDLVAPAAGSGFVSVDVGAVNVDFFTLTSSSGFLVDDVVFQVAAEPVPEPATVVLLLFGVAGLGLRRFRKQ